jgi:hypothetical protein
MYPHEFTASRAAQHRSDLVAAAEHARDCRRAKAGKQHGLRLRIRRPAQLPARPAVVRPLVQLPDAL